MYIVDDMLFTDIQKKFYINQYGVFYEGQELESYDYQGNYIQNVVINKFVIHYDRSKKPFMSFNFSRVGQKYNMTLPCEKYLGITYRRF